MNLIHSFLLVLHIIAGTGALIVFWLPALAKKGSAKHIRYGRYFVYVMYSSAATGCLMALLVILDPIAIHPQIGAELADPEQQVRVIQSFWSFLLYLSLLTATAVRHGVLVLRHKADRAPLRHFSHLILTGSLAGFGPILAFWGYQQQMPLLMIFGVLGLVIGSKMVHYSFKNSLTQLEWWIEHLGAMIAAGIAAYTAFFSFGVNRLLKMEGIYQLMGWILPGVIGTLFIKYLTYYYRKKFSATARSGQVKAAAVVMADTLDQS